MEAANIGGAREADVAPAADPIGGRSAGWTPADPGPLGLAGFAGTTFMLSMLNSGLVGKGSLLGGGLLPLVATIALAYGGIAQLIAGIWEFRTGNTFGAVAFCSYGAFWISVFLIVQLGAGAILTEKGNSLSNFFAGFSLYLYTWTIFTTYMFVASLRTSGAVALTFFLLTITFLLLAIGNASLVGTLHITNNTIKLGGYLGIATAIVAWYASFAAVINSTFGRVVAPVVPLSR
jgi:uncharacterized protein